MSSDKDIDYRRLAAAWAGEEYVPAPTIDPAILVRSRYCEPAPIVSPQTSGPAPKGTGRSLFAGAPQAFRPGYVAPTFTRKGKARRERLPFVDSRAGLIQVQAPLKADPEIKITIPRLREDTTDRPCGPIRKTARQAKHDAWLARRAAEYVPVAAKATPVGPVTGVADPRYAGLLVSHERACRVGTDPRNRRASGPVCKEPKGSGRAPSSAPTKPGSGGMPREAHWGQIR